MYHYNPETHLGGKQNDGNQATPTMQTVEVVNIIMVVKIEGCFQTNNSNTKGNQLQTKMDQFYKKLVFMTEDSVNNYGWKTQWVEIRKHQGQRTWRQYTYPEGYLTKDKTKLYNNYYYNITYYF